MPTLEEYTSTHRAKLARRLEKQSVRSISHISYDQYLRSTLWKSIREWVIAAQAGRCSICDHAAEEVHHHEYSDETMWGKRSDELVGLCPRCHHFVEFNEDRTKRVNLVEKRAVFDRLLETFQCLRREGFPLFIKRAGLNINIEYIGKPELQKFLECSSLGYGFVVWLMQSEISVPLPLGREKLTQKTGVRLSLSSTSKHIATVWADTRSITIKRTKACTFPIETHLRTFLSEKPYVVVKE
jgi:hypothetical protein